MKIRFLLIFTLLSYQVTAHAADLLEVYQQAQCSDPKFQQAIAQRLVTKEGVPISVAALLPNITGQFTPTLTRSGFSGTALQSVVAGGVPITISPRNTTTRFYTLSLNITQTVFDFGKFSAVAGALADSKGADATLNAALQDLMIRVSKAYFDILKDEDDLIYSQATKRAYAEQLSQVQQQYKVGLKTLTDVYTAEASYDTAVANVIAAETKLADDRENLRVITGRYYPHLLAISDDFPLLTPQPADIDEWVKVALVQNWSIKASQYAVDSALQNVRQQFAGHLPTVDVQAGMNRLYTDNINKYINLLERNGPAIQTNRSVGLTINIPIFSGGGVVASTNQAIYNYQLTQQQLEQTVRDNLNKTRQSYLGVISGKSQIKADKQAIKSSISSFQGMEASYRVGTETLVNVLNQQEKVYQAQTTYAADRYKFLNDLLALKQAAGTLCFDDLRSINVWLVERKETANKPLNYSYPTKKKMKPRKKIKAKKKIVVLKH